MVVLQPPARLWVKWPIIRLKFKGRIPNLAHSGSLFVLLSILRLYHAKFK